jgi:dethiobiotin synthetase
VKNILFVTGTDTGIGKTVISCLIARELSEQGVSLNVLKPVETGCSPDADGVLQAGDAKRLLSSSRSNQTIESVVPYRLRAPLAPSIAAKLESVEIDFAGLLSHAEELAQDCELLIVEGAGGVLVPITEQQSYGDFASASGAATLLVVGSRLGCINHTLLSIEALLTREVPLLGYVLNDLFADGADTGSDGTAISSNRDALQRATDAYGVTERYYLPFCSEYAAGNDTPVSPPGIQAFSDTIIEYFALKR